MQINLKMKKQFEDTEIFGWAILFILLVGVSIMLANSVSAATTSTNVTVNNTASVLSQIYLYNVTGNYSSNSSVFDYRHNITVNANITDINGRDDIDKTLISIQDYYGNVLIQNASMNRTNITNGYLLNYTYPLNTSSIPGNYTITIFYNDSGSNSVSNSTVALIMLTIQASVSSPSSSLGHSMTVYSNLTNIGSYSTDATGKIVVQSGFPIYTIFYHPKAGWPSWETTTANTCYAGVTIQGTAGAAGTGGGGSSSAITPEVAKSLIPTQFTFDLRFKAVWLSQDNNIVSECIIKNVGDRKGDVTIRYSIIQNSSVYNSKEEQAYITPYVSDAECSTLICPYPSYISLPFGCWADTFLRVEIIGNTTGNITQVLAKTEQMVCNAQISEEPQILIPVETTTTLPAQQQRINPMLALGIGGTILIVILILLFI